MDVVFTITVWALIVWGTATELRRLS